ncbi:MAG: transporter substrate-binding domain-containing protein [Pseudomonadota bacterium]
MRAERIILCLCLAGAATCTVAAPRPFLAIFTEHTPPSSMTVNGQITGFATEKVRAVMARAGIDYRIDMLPWTRALALATSQPDTCLYSTTRTSERDKLFKWVGPTHENDWTMFARADRGIRLASLEDARKLRIGAYNGDVRGETLQGEGFSVDSVRDNFSNPRKLMAGRIDLWVTSLRVGKTISRELGWPQEIVPVLTFKRTELYLACHPSVSDALIARMNSALQAMNREGVSKEIEHRFDFWGIEPNRASVP